MAEKSGGKAELDKDGIPLGPAKAELDKDGIPLKEASEAKPAEPAAETSAAPAQVAALSDRFKQHKWLIIGLGAAALLLVVVLIAVVLILGGDEEPPPAVVAKPAPEAPVALPADQLALEPFIISYVPLDKQHQGVLIVRLNLKIEPQEALNVQSRLYQIRNVIFESLAKNAALYDEADLQDILARELRPLGIRGVVFASFEQR